MSAVTVTDLIERALEAYADLELLGEEIEDEWTYVTDLEAAWRARLDAVSGARGSEPVAPADRRGGRSGDRGDRSRA